MSTAERTMQALLYPAFDTLERATLARPVPGPGEVLLRVAACGLCGSELETFKSRSPRRRPPLVMGHEFCGTVEAVGPGVAAFGPGQRVVSHSLVACGACAPCRRGQAHLCARRQVFGMHRPGAFAEFVAAPAAGLVPWPEGLPAEVACLAEPLANGLHAARLTEALRPERVLVVGAGPIGLMAQQAYQHRAGAQVLVADLNPARLAVARRLGAARTVYPREDDLAEAARAWTDGEGVDVAVDAVGAARTRRDALAATRPGGAVVWIGLHEREAAFDAYDVILPEKQILGSYAATASELAEAVGLLAEGAVDAASWTHVFPLAEGAAAFRRMLAAEGDDVKAVLVP